MNHFTLGDNKDISTQDAQNIREKIIKRFPDISVHV